jgi:imidazoleglycerol-phosphate dehydratase
VVSVGFGDVTVPLDEASAQVVVDVSGRSCAVCAGKPDGFEFSMIGGHFTGSLVRHVMGPIAFNAGLSLHIRVSGRALPPPIT